MLSATVQIPSDPGGGTVARRFTTAQLEQWKYGGSHEDVLIVATELVVNAIRHAGGTILLRLALDERCLRLEVSDGSSEVPVPRPPGPTGGFGFHIVTKLCARWGVDRHETGKIVWCEHA